MIKKVISTIIILMGFLLLQKSFANSVELSFDNSFFTGYFSGIQNYKTDLNFKYNGNNFEGIIFRKSTSASAGSIITLNSQVKTCNYRLEGLYYNSQRGNRLWPLDQNSLNRLKLIDSGYNNLFLTGGLYVGCAGGDSNLVYGDVTHQYAGIIYELIAGVNYNFTGNTYIANNYSTGSLFISGGIFNGYLFDNYGGIGSASGFIASTPNTIINTPNVTTFVSIENLTGFMVFSGSIQLSGVNITGVEFVTTGILKITNPFDINNYLQMNLDGLKIVASGNFRTGVLNSPLIISNPTLGFGGLPLPSEGYISRSILKTISVGSQSSQLLAKGGYFRVNLKLNNGVSGITYKIYKSEDNINWKINTPDKDCILNSNLICSFDADNLFYFVIIDEALTHNAPLLSGGARLIMDNCLYNPNSSNNLPGSNSSGKDYSPSYYDKSCLEGSEGNLGLGMCSVKESTFGQELNSAFQYNFYIGTTTVCPVGNARLNKNISRAELAKMISKFALLNVGLEPNTNKQGCSSYSDTKNLSIELMGYVTLACQLDLMGIHSENKKAKSQFNPNSSVTRAEFGSVFSRLIYGNKYDGNNENRYINHLNALKKDGIMTKIENPKMSELRGYAMIMIRRTDRDGLVKRNQ